MTGDINQVEETEIIITKEDHQEVDQKKIDIEGIGMMTEESMIEIIIGDNQVIEIGIIEIDAGMMIGIETEEKMANMKMIGIEIKKTETSEITIKMIAEEIEMIEMQRIKEVIMLKKKKK